MRKNLTAVLGFIGFMAVLGGAGAYEQGGSTRNFLFTSAAGFMLVGLAWLVHRVWQE